MTPKDRNEVALSNEGQLLALAGAHSVQYAADVARGVADGAMNALIRLEGREEAAKYAFALADRVVGAVLSSTPTAWVPPAPLEVSPSPEELPPPRRRVVLVKLWIAACLVTAGAVLAMWCLRRWW